MNFFFDANTILGIFDNEWVSLTGHVNMILRGGMVQFDRSLLGWPVLAESDLRG
jgi:hypothetical protein